MKTSTPASLFMFVLLSGACIGGPPGEEGPDGGAPPDGSPADTRMERDTTEPDAGGDTSPVTDAGDADVGPQGPSFVEVTSARHASCALTSNGRPLCWGGNQWRVVSLVDAIGAPPNWPFEEDVTFESLVGGGERMCGVTTDAEFVCWGDNNHSAIRIDINDGWFNPPTTVDLMTAQAIVSIGAGPANTCVVLGDQRVLCWGENQYGLVDAPSFDDLGPMERLRSAKSIDVGANHACIVTSDDRARCWGRNSMYKVSPNNQMLDLPPVTVDNANYRAVVTATSHSCGIRANGQVACWGSASGAKLGVDDDFLEASDLPVVVPNLNNVTELVAGTQHTCALVNGEAYCWGHWHASAGTVPVKFTSPDGTGFVSISAGANFSCAVSGGGNIYCWGENRSSGTVGQFDGDGMALDQRFTEPTPVPVPDAR